MSKKPQIIEHGEVIVISPYDTHAYALCHRDDKEQVERCDIENLALLIDASNMLTILLDGDKSSGSTPAGWVMLLESEEDLDCALKWLREQERRAENPEQE